VAAADAQTLDHRAHHLARGAHVADVAHREHQIAADDPGCDRPLRALRLEAEIGDLRDHVLAHAAEHEHVQVVAHLGLRERLAERAQRVGRQRGRSIRRISAGLWSVCR
jgi:hypothetical protein